MKHLHPIVVAAFALSWALIAYGSGRNNEATGPSAPEAGVPNRLPPSKAQPAYTKLPARHLIRLVVDGGSLSASIDPQKGAELVGLEFSHSGEWLELLYRGLDFSPTKGWDGKAPLLWPATGRNVLPTSKREKVGSHLGWIWQGHTYPMPIHGFARDYPWRVDGLQTKGKQRAFVRLTFAGNRQTQVYYPFHFKFTTEYILYRSRLEIRQIVRASTKNETAMPFSIGDHVSFNWPLVPGGSAAAVRFRTPATKQVLLTAENKPTGQVRNISFSRLTPLSSLPPRKVTALAGYPSGEEWFEIADPAGISVRVAHRETRKPAGLPVLFNLWGDIDSGFFCPEPWVGKANSLMSGDGLIRLQPGATFEWTVVIAVHDSDHSRLTTTPP